MSTNDAAPQYDQFPTSGCGNHTNPIVPYLRAFTAFEHGQPYTSDR